LNIGSLDFKELQVFQLEPKGTATSSRTLIARLFRQALMLCRVVKHSCGFVRIVFQESPEPFTTLHGACTLWILADRRKEQDIAFALMIALVMIMLYVLVEHVPEGSFSKQDQPR